MASHRLLFSSLLFLLLAIGATARPGIHFHPCKTLFISSFTISSSSLDSRNPNSIGFQVIQNPNEQNPPRFFTVFREIRGFRFRQQQQQQQQPLEQSFEIIRPDFNTFSRSDFQFPIRPRIPLRYSDKTEIRNPNNDHLGSFGISSLRERTKDILSVVVALLFGAGCGALTSATMYLAWSLITDRNEFHGSEYDNDSESDDDVSPKKMGYVKIPSVTPPAAAAVAVPVQPKEVE